MQQFTLYLHWEVSLTPLRLNARHLRAPPSFKKLRQSSSPPFSHSPHLRCRRVCLALLSKFILNMTISHHLFHYTLSLRWNVFCRFLTGLTASTLVLQQSIVYSAVRVIFQSYKSKHVTPLLRTLEWVPFSVKPKALNNGLQGPIRSAPHPVLLKSDLLLLSFLLILLYPHWPPCQACSHNKASELAGFISLSKYKAKISHLLPIFAQLSPQ